MKQIVECVNKGQVDESAHINAHGNWSATVSYFTGGDYVRVATAISEDKKGELIVVITVII
jgi:hypothetical protein